MDVNLVFSKDVWYAMIYSNENYVEWLLIDDSSYFAFYDWKVRNNCDRCRRINTWHTILRSTVVQI